MFRLNWVFALTLSTPLVAVVSTSLSDFERRELDARIERFYSNPKDAGAMDMTPLKWDVTKSKKATINAVLLKNSKIDPAHDPLLFQAQKKSDPAFRRDRCERFLKAKFPKLDCEKELGWETIRPHDKPQDLARTWIEETSFQTSLASLKTNGATQREVWSGDYWRMRWGLTSYRYFDDARFLDYKASVDSFEQPKEWIALISSLPSEKWNAVVHRWSPAEKYDLLLGDEGFQLTREQKYEGARYLGENGNVESWFGICHGWAPASIFAPAPRKPVTARGAKNVAIQFLPDDIKALTTLAWANGKFSSNFIGGRCGSKKVNRFENGRVSDPECFDNNPATWHLAVTNLLGEQGIPFVMDASYDYEVWNQPVVAYEFLYFNPLDIKKRSAQFESVMVDYDDAFKSKDRFQKPLTRGESSGSGAYDDTKIQKVVGVMATVVYLSESTATHSELPTSNSTTRVTYTYDLELQAVGGQWVPTGGEWHANAHPDFLWLPEKESVAMQPIDKYLPAFSLSAGPNENSAKVAGTSSRRGYPLCSVVESLVNAASGSSTYRCH